MAEHPNDAELRELLRSPGLDRLEDFYRRFAAMVFQVATVVTENRSLARSVAEDALVSIWDRATRGAVPERNLKAWVIGVTHAVGVRRARPRSGRMSAATGRGGAVRLARWGYTYPEIATALGLTVDEALTRLRDELRALGSAAECVAARSPGTRVADVDRRDRT